MAELQPLAGLTGLVELTAENTNVKDATVLQGLTNLHDVRVSNSAGAPIKGMEFFRNRAPVREKTAPRARPFLTRTIHEYLLRRPVLSSGEDFLVRPPRRTARTPSAASRARSPGGLRPRTPRDGIHE